MLNLYQEIIMDHYHNPRNNVLIDGCNMQGMQRNSSCGDEVMCTGIIDNNILVNVAFKGKGCVISQATASILSEFVHHKSIDIILALDNADLVGMIGMQLGPVRLLCGLLPLNALQCGIRAYKTGM